MFAGSAPYRKPAKAEKFPESLDGDTMLEYLPPRAPELDPAGMRRGAIKRPPAGRIFGTLEVAEESAREASRAGELTPAGLFD